MTICDTMHLNHTWKFHICFIFCVMRICIFTVVFELLNSNLLGLFFQISEEISPFCGAIDTLVSDFWWCPSWISKPGSIPCMHAFLPACNSYLRFIFHWCDTCWPLVEQHGSVLVQGLVGLKSGIECGLVICWWNKSLWFGLSEHTQRGNIDLCWF